MSSTSTNFSLVLATGSDTVNVVTQIANNFATVDSLLSIVHTGTGQLKNSLVLPTPTLSSPTLTGTMSGGTIVASTGRFNTITATGGALTINTLTVGTYGIPGTIGSTNQVLTAITGNAQWATPSGSGTGASAMLDNLASVAINTSLGTFTAGFVTFARVIATSGALTGLTSFQATTGTFAGAVLISANATIAGTATINAVNCTGGAITAAGFAIGTYSYPATVGSTSQVLTVTTGNAQWLTLVNSHVTAYFSALATSGDGLTVGLGAQSDIPFSHEEIDTTTQYNAATTAFQFTITASGYYQMGANVIIAGSAGGTNAAQLYLVKSAGPTEYFLGAVRMVDTSPSYGIAGGALVLATSGDKFGVQVLNLSGAGNIVVSQTIGKSRFYGHKIPDR